MVRSGIRRRIKKRRSSYRYLLWRLPRPFTSTRSRSNRLMMFLSPTHTLR